VTDDRPAVELGDQLSAAEAGTGAGGKDDASGANGWGFAVILHPRTISGNRDQKVAGAAVAQKAAVVPAEGDGIAPTDSSDDDAGRSTTRRKNSISRSAW
jgi:hypothetical protein